MMSKIEQLKAIQDMPLTAAYWMGRRDAYAEDIEKIKEQHTVAGLDKCKYELANSLWLFDQANDNFAHEMGWV